MPSVNESLLKKKFIAQHGEVLGGVAFQHYVTEIQKRIDAYETAQREKIELTRQLYELEAALPSLTPFVVAMNSAYSAWLEKCQALEAQRQENSTAGASLRRRIEEIDRNLAEATYPAHIEDWKYKESQDGEAFRESFADQALRQMYHSRRGN